MFAHMREYTKIESKWNFSNISRKSIILIGVATALGLVYNKYYSDCSKHIKYCEMISKYERIPFRE